MNFSRIDSKLHKLNTYRPLSNSILQKIRESERPEMIYNSNGIEGNTLTYQETFLVLQEGLTASGKPLKDHLEVQDHNAVMDWLYDLVDGKQVIQITEHMIRSVHALVLQSTNKEWAGSYRTGNVRIGGSDHVPPGVEQVPYLMNELVEWFKTDAQKLHPVEQASLLHHKFVHIHPFFDGNGRTARTLMNLTLIHYGYPLAIIKKVDRKKYIRAISHADSGDYERLIRLTAGSVENSLDRYLAMLGDELSREDMMTLKELSNMEDISFSAKYLNLLARQGKLEAHKRGRLWYSSREAVQRYLDNRERKR